MGAISDLRFEISEALDLEFGGGVFEVIARAGVGAIAEKVVHRVDIDGYRRRAV